MTLSQLADRVITLADLIRDYWSAELPKRHPDYPMINAGEDSGPPPPEQEELRKLLFQQPTDMLYKLLLIMYLGRGDYGVQNLSEHYQHIQKMFSRPELAARQMLEKAPLGDYLLDGLNEMRGAGLDVDRLDFTPLRSGS